MTSQAGQEYYRMKTEQLRQAFALLFRVSSPVGQEANKEPANGK